MCTNDRQGDAVVPNSAYFQKDWNPGHGPLDQSEIAAYQTSAAKMVFKSMDADSNGNLSHREVKNYVSYSIPCVDSVRVLQLGVRSARRRCSLATSSLLTFFVGSRAHTLVGMDNDVVS